MPIGLVLRDPRQLDGEPLTPARKDVSNPRGELPSERKHVVGERIEILKVVAPDAKLVLVVGHALPARAPSLVHRDDRAGLVNDDDRIRERVQRRAVQIVRSG